MITMTPYNVSLDIYNMQDNYMCVKYIFQHIEMTFILYKGIVVIFNFLNSKIF